MAPATEVQAQTLKQALVAGGQGSFVQEKLSKSLARHGIRVHTLVVGQAKAASEVP